MEHRRPGAQVLLQQLVLPGDGSRSHGLVARIPADLPAQRVEAHHHADLRGGCKGGLARRSGADGDHERAGSQVERRDDEAHGCSSLFWPSPGAGAAPSRAKAARKTGTFSLSIR